MYEKPLRTSTNYKMSSKKDGNETCELVNKHEISLINENTKLARSAGGLFLGFVKLHQAQGAIWFTFLDKGARLYYIRQWFNMFQARRVVEATSYLSRVLVTLSFLGPVYKEGGLP